MKQINDLEFIYVIVIDFVVRGIDIKGVSYVINYELLDDFDFYIYCVGRMVCVGLLG